MTATARGPDASGIERCGYAVQARYASRLQLGDDGGYVGSPRSGTRYAGSGGGLLSAWGEAGRTLRHDLPLTQPPLVRLGR
jgi:hypothetical protein